MYVYGIQSGQFIKVGATDDVQKRLRTFQLHNPHPLKIVLRQIVVENYWVEKRMHKLLAQYSVGREWFDCPPDVVRAAFKATLKDLVANRHLIVGTARGWRNRTEAETARLAAPRPGQYNRATAQI